MAVRCVDRVKNQFLLEITPIFINQIKYLPLNSPQIKINLP